MAKNKYKYCTIDAPTTRVGTRQLSAIFDQLRWRNKHTQFRKRGQKPRSRFNLNTIRYSIDESQILLFIDHDEIWPPLIREDPSFVRYNHDEAEALMETPEWKIE